MARSGSCESANAALVLHYLDTYCAESRSEIDELAEQIAYANNKPLTENISMIPVAADEASHWIQRATGILARQPTPEGGLTMILGLNGAPGKPIEPQTREAALVAAEENPGLDLRVVDMGIFSRKHQDGRKIISIMPTLRKRLAAGSMAAWVKQGLRDDHDVLLHINDIDIMDLSGNFFQEMRTRHTEIPWGVLLARGRHSYYANMPRLNTLIAACDLDEVLTYQPAVFEPAVALSLPTYCNLRGFNDNGTLGETIQLARKGECVSVSTAELVASGRRHAQRFGQGESSVWPDTGFEFDGLTYRTQEPQKDVEEQVFWKILDRTLQDNVNRYADNIIQAANAIVEGNIGQSDGFITSRDMIWAWARKKIEAAIPRFTDFQQFCAKLEQPLPKSYDAVVKNPRKMLESIAYQVIRTVLLREYLDISLEDLVKGDFEAAHQGYIDALRAIPYDLNFDDMWSPRA